MKRLLCLLLVGCALVAGCAGPGSGAGTTLPVSDVIPLGAKLVRQPQSNLPLIRQPFVVTHPTNLPPNSQPGSIPEPIVFSSDQSVLLKQAGETYQLRATSPVGAVTYRSNDPSIATVTPSGYIVAKGHGTATILASSGPNAATVTVLVAQTGPNDVIVRSEDVESASSSAAVLLDTPATRVIHAGQVVVSGSRGHLIGSVTAVRVAGGTVTLALAPTTFPEAFPNANANIAGVRRTSTLHVEGRREWVELADGRTLDVPAGTWNCTGSSGLPSTLTFENQSVSAKFSVVSHFVVSPSSGAPQTIQIYATVDGVIQGSAGDLVLSAGASGSFNCAVSPGVLDVEPVGYGPLVLGVEGSAIYGIQGSVVAGGQLTVAGPTISYTFYGSEGLSYSNGTWSQINSGTPGGSLTLTPANPSVSVSGDFSATIEPYAEANLGAYIGIVGGFRIVSFQFVDAAIYGELGLDLNGSLTATALTYSGPQWNGAMGLAVAYSPSLGGAIVPLLHYFGIPTTFPATTLYSKKIALVGSPSIRTTAAAAAGNGLCPKTLTATIIDDHVLPLGYDDDAVKFAVVSGPGAPFIAGSATVTGSTGQLSASTTWSPTVSGTYQVVALLYDRVFGAAGLPYPSLSQTVACNPAPSSSPSPSGPPTITSIYPNPVVGSNSRQTVDVYGTNFANVPTITLTWTGQPNYTVPASQVTFVSSTEIQISIGTTTQADNWTVKVTDPGGAASNVFPFAVVAPTATPTPGPAPTITSIYPNPVVGSSGSQTIDIYGANFANVPALTLTWTGQPNYPVPATEVTFVSSTEIQMSIKTTTQPDYWTVKVTNPGGAASNVFGFNVVAPTPSPTPTPTPTPQPAPTITSIYPNPVVGSSGSQTIDIYGANFANVPALTLTWTGQPNYPVPATEVTFVSSTEIQMSIKTTTQPDYWTVKVTNPGGAASNVFGFNVVAP